MSRALILALLVLAACAPAPVDPRLGVYMDSTGQVHPSARGSFGGVTIGARPGGGSVSTSIGMLDLGAAF